MNKVDFPGALTRSTANADKLDMDSRTDRAARRPGKRGGDRPRTTRLLSSLVAALLLASRPPAAVAGHEGPPPPRLATDSVPGPPEWATLDVVGSRALLATFAPPLRDGGVPVESYLVEWDKEAGIPEVQRVAVSQNLDANEVQAVTTSAADVDELQVVRTAALPRAEVQAVTVSPPFGDDAVDAAYGFALSLDTVGRGGSLQYSGYVGAQAPADGTRASLAEILEHMANVPARPSVTRSATNPDGGHTYLVTFPLAMGDVPEMEVFLSDLPATVTTLEEGNALAGSFRLEFDGALTVDLPVDASAAEVWRALEDLSTVGAVAVARGPADDQGGRVWEVQFLSDVNGGDVPQMIAHGDGLRTSHPVGGATVEVSTARDGSYVAGSFTLSFREC